MKNNGFTLIEVSVVMFIIFLSFVLLPQLRNKTLMNATVNLVVADIRNAHFKAISSTRYGNQIRCGYGIGDILTDTNQYFIYAGPTYGSPLSSPAGATVDCATQNRHYCAAPLGLRSVMCALVSKQDVTIENRQLFSNRFEFKSGVLSANFYDIFFEPPDPKVFVCQALAACNSTHSALTISPAVITIGQVNLTCVQSLCKSICVYTSGRIEVVNGTTCL